jgi:hypothetical protein
VALLVVLAAVLVLFPVRAKYSGAHVDPVTLQSSNLTKHVSCGVPIVQPFRASTNAPSLADIRRAAEANTTLTPWPSRACSIAAGRRLALGVVLLVLALGFTVPVLRRSRPRTGAAADDTPGPVE